MVVTKPQRGVGPVLVQSTPYSPANVTINVSGWFFPVARGFSHKGDENSHVADRSVVLGAYGTSQAAHDLLTVLTINLELSTCVLPRIALNVGSAGT